MCLTLAAEQEEITGLQQDYIPVSLCIDFLALHFKMRGKQMQTHTVEHMKSETNFGLKVEERE